MSCEASRRSNPIEALIASMIASGPAAKRPPHIAFEVLSVMVQLPGILRSALLYTALALGANAATADTAALEALREGDMRKLIFHAEPRPVGRPSSPIPTARSTAWPTGRASWCS
jgi:hypothetical protein